MKERGNTNIEDIHNRKYRKNKSSIVRVIISNFDDKSIKEIKVLYKKQGGVDTIRVKTELVFPEGECNGKIKFYVEEAYNRLEGDQFPKEYGEEREEDKFSINYEEEHEKIIVRKNKFNREYKEYSISGTCQKTKTGKIKVSVTVVDNIFKYEYDEFIRQTRSNKSHTERVLLGEETIKFYEKIVDDTNISIDSKEIYKVNRFFEYRSNMLIYFQIINNMLVKDINQVSEEKIQEIWRFKDVKKDGKYYKILESMAYESLGENENKNFNISQFIKNKDKWFKKEKNRFKSLIEKAKDKEETEKILKYEKELEELETNKIDLKDSEIKDDLVKIIDVFSEFRHLLMHYNYGFFRDIYSGREVLIYSKDKDEKLNLSELLDLNIVKNLEKVKLYLEESKTNYLEKNTEIYVLGKRVNAKKLLGIYNNLCDRKNGFNKFVNSNLERFVEEDKSSNSFVEKFFSQIENLGNYLKKEEEKIKNFKGKKRETAEKKVNKIRNELEEYINLKNWFGNRCYLRDIHSSKEYKKLYNYRKGLINRNEIYIFENKKIKTVENTNKISENNTEILELNRKMKEMTDTNSKYRLQIKLQFAFGYLKREFNLDIKKFMDNFEVLNEKPELSLEEFIKIMDEANSRDISKFIKNYEFKELNSMFKKEPSNNLIKFYILMYNLLPRELRGDFLGFVKKNYYDVKHVEFIDKDANKDLFFHNLRLFEKNLKNLEIINYDFLNAFDEKSKKIVNSNIEKVIDKKLIKYPQLKKKVEEDGNSQFVKALVLPIMNYYQIVFKLANDLEIELLYNLMEKENYNNFDIALKKCKVRGYYNFRELVRKLYIGNISSEINGFIWIRNNLAHLDGENLFYEILKNYRNDIEPISRKVEEGYLKFLEIGRTKGIDFNNLTFNILNDYYMKKERLIYNLELDIRDEKRFRVSKVKKEIKKNKEKLDINLYLKDLEDLVKIKDKLDEVKNKSKEKSDVDGKISDTVGQIKSILIREVKKIPLDIIRNGETRFINVDVFNVVSKKSEFLKFRFRYDLKNNVYKLYKSDCLKGNINLVKITEEETKDKVLLQCEDNSELEKDLDYKYIQNVKFIINR